MKKTQDRVLAESIPLKLLAAPTLITSPVLVHFSLLNAFSLSPCSRVPSFSLVPLLFKIRPHSNRQLQPLRSIFQGIMQPALLDFLPVYHHASLGCYRLARIQSTLIPTPFGLPLFRLFSPSLWAAEHLAKSWISVSSLRAESGERRALWHGILLLSLALVALAACAALMHCNRLLHALFVRPSFDLSVSITEVFECRFKVVDKFGEYALGITSYLMPYGVEHDAGSDHRAEFLEHGFGIGASMLWSLAFLNAGDEEC
jgi:hypothetical protein